MSIRLSNAVMAANREKNAEQAAQEAPAPAASAPKAKAKAKAKRRAKAA